MIIKVLDRETLGMDLPIEKLDTFGKVEVYDSTSRDELFSRISDAEVIVINKVKIDGVVLESTSALKLICVFATGYDNIDINAAKKHNVAVCNVPAYSTESVALFTITNVLSLFTKLNDYTEYVRNGSYTSAGKANCLVPTFHEMKGMTWGIVGYGNIGKRVAEIATALGAKVIVNKQTPNNEFECVDIDTLCQRSDIITLHCPLTEKTKKLINRERISLMKPSAILVNQARGGVTDEEAIANALLNKKIAAFGSDVYSIEPFPSNHPFNSIKNLPNVCLTPHSAWAAYESRVRALQITCKNIADFFDGKPTNRVDIV